MHTFCGLTTDGMLEYLATIWRLGGEEGNISTSRLAEAMHVSPAAASSMAKRLRESGFLQRSPEGGNMLTDQGRLAALQLVRRHRLLEVFLIQVMGFTWDQVDAESHLLEQAISPAFEDRMDHLCGFPTHCPHGDPIPRKDGTMPDEDLCPVVELQPGERATLRRVGMKEPPVLRYLSGLNLTPGSQLRLVEVAPFRGPVTLELLDDDDQPPVQQIVGAELAAELYVARMN